MSIDSYGIHIWFLYIRFYGIIIMLGVVLAAYVASVRAGKKGENTEHVWDMLTWAVVAGVIGARLWHILTPPKSMVDQGITFGYYLTHPLDAINITNGGLGIVGAVVGGVLAVLWYVRRHKLSFAKWTDYIAPGLLLAQAVGRWGNFVNQELYGMPTSLPWGIYIAPEARRPYMPDNYYHPLFLYESLWNLLNIGILLWLERRFSKYMKAGDVFLGYLVLYPITRFVLEFMRVDSAPVAGININQWLMFVTMIAALGFLVWRHRGDFGAAKTQLEVPSSAPVENGEYLPALDNDIALEATETPEDEDTPEEDISPLDTEKDKSK